MKTKRYFTFLLLFCFVSFAYGIPDDPITVLLKKLEEFTKKQPTEKVYLHLDKPYYAVGDDIWFKAYLTTGQTSEPSKISKILYVELINEKNEIERKLRLPVENGITWGDFKLTDTLLEGNYRIRAYTQWMRNSSPHFFFNKVITIGAAWQNKVYTEITNTYRIENDNEVVTSVIRFYDGKGDPYPSSEVAYKVTLDDKNIRTATATTNSEGKITISFVNTKPSLHQTGEIAATLSLSDKSKITKHIPIKTTSQGIDTQFFPESGQLVEGLPTKVGIKAINTNGLGEELSGRIIDENGNEMLRFATNHLGMGSFIINPQSGKTYAAEIKSSNGNIKQISLPKVVKSGFVMNVDNSDSSKIGVRTLASEDMMNKGDLILIAHRYGTVYFTAKLPGSKQINFVSLPKEKLPSGIIQFTLLTTNFLPLCERIVFVNNTSDKIKLSLNKLKETYTKRENVNLSLSATAAEIPVMGSFSVSVTNTGIVAPDLENESNILTSLLLTSDLTGYIEKPNYYFLDDNPKRKIDLDYLMLTQGWRKINWEEIDTNKIPSQLFDSEKEMTISGTVFRNNKPAPKSSVSLTSMSGSLMKLDTISDETGRFVFRKLFFIDSAKLILKATTLKGSTNVEIRLDEIPNQVVDINKNTGDIEVNVNDKVSSYLQGSNAYFADQAKRGNLKSTINLKQVNITGKKKTELNSSNLNGSGRSDFSFTAKDLENVVFLSSYFNRVPGVKVQGGRPYLIGAGMGASAPMSVVLDGVYRDQFSLDDIAAQNIQSVEILKSANYTAIYGIRGSAGVVVITTKKGGNDSTNPTPAGVLIYQGVGFDRMRQFYSPKYTVKIDPEPDLRTTVYWHPNLTSDDKGMVNFDYFNTDQTGVYRIVIEGFDLMGNLGRKVFTYQVN